MHELSLSSAIVNTAVKHAGGRRVSVVTVRVGTLRQVVPDFRCPSCEQGGVEILAGNEFEVESIDVEEVACIA